MYSAIDISKWFLAKNISESKTNAVDGEYEGISPLKMQKLLYYAQGIHLALHDTPLFKEDIYAWPHGPVVIEVYNEYKHCGSNPIALNIDKNDARIIDALENDKNAHESLELTYDNFAIYTAWQLRNMTHVQGGPWDTITAHRGTNAIIPTACIKKYFLDNILDEN